MKTTAISYVDDLGDAITKPEFDLLTSRGIAYSENNVVKKVEYFNEGLITFVRYYLADGEDISAVLDSYNDVSVEFITTYRYYKYTIEEVNAYRNKSLKFYSKNLFDEFNNVICEQAYNISTKEPILESTEKYLFNNPDDIFSLGFEYDNLGMLKYIWGNMVDQTDQNQRGTIPADMIATYFPNLLTNNPYYINAEFLPQIIA